MINAKEIPCGAMIVFGRKAHFLSSKWSETQYDPSSVEVMFDDKNISESILIDDPIWQTAYYEGSKDRELKIHAQQQEIYELYSQLFSIRTEMMHYRNFKDQGTLKDAINEANEFLATKKPTK